MKIAQVIAGLLAFAALGCSARPAGPVPGAVATPPTEAINSLAFPADGPSRSVQAIETITLAGADYFYYYGDVTLGASSLTLQPDAKATSFAVYRFHPGAFPVGAVDFIVTANEPSKTWFGVPDYLNLNWEFTQAEPAMATLPLTSSNVSVNGYLYFAVIANNQTDTVIQSISIDLDQPTWATYVLDDQNHAGEVVSAERYGNLIGIAYSASDTEELRFAKSTALLPAAATDWTFTEIITNTQTDAIELEKINDLPMVAYTHSQTGENRFARAANTSPAGSGDWYTVFPARDSKPGNIALTGVNDAPAVAYVDPGLSLNSVDYTYSPIGDPFTLSDWTVTEAVSNTMMPPFAEFSDVFLMSSGGLPYMMYFNEDHDRLYFLAASSATPADPAGWSGGPVTEPGSGRGCQGIEFGDMPALVYLDHTRGNLSYTRGSSWTPTGTGDWFQSHDIDPGGRADGPLCIARLSLGMGVAYFDTASESIKYAWVESGTPGTGKSWRIVTAVADVGTDPAYSLVVQQNGLPGIAYYDGPTDSLMYTAMQE